MRPLTSLGFREVQGAWVLGRQEGQVHALPGEELLVWMEASWQGATVRTGAGRPVGDPGFDAFLGVVNDGGRGRFHGLHAELRRCLLSLARLGEVHVEPSRVSVRLWNLEELPQAVEGLVAAVEQLARPVSMVDVVEEPFPLVAADALKWLIEADPASARAVAASARRDLGHRFWSVERARALTDVPAMAALLREGGDGDEAAHAVEAFAPAERLTLLVGCCGGNWRVAEGASRWLATWTGPGGRELLSALKAWVWAPDVPTPVRAEVLWRLWRPARRVLVVDDAPVVMGVLTVAQGPVMMEALQWMERAPGRVAGPLLREAVGMRRDQAGKEVLQEALEGLARPGALSVPVERGELSVADDG